MAGTRDQRPAHGAGLAPRRSRGRAYLRPPPVSARRPPPVTSPPAAWRLAGGGWKPSLQYIPVLFYLQVGTSRWLGQWALVRLMTSVGCRRAQFEPGKNGGRNSDRVDRCDVEPGDG